MKTRKKHSRLTAALLEMAEDQHRLGFMDDATYEKITARHLGSTTNWNDLKHKSAPEVRANLQREAHAELERTPQNTEQNTGRALSRAPTHLFIAYPHNS